MTKLGLVDHSDPAAPVDPAPYPRSSQAQACHRRRRRQIPLRRVCKLPGAGARYECGRGAACDQDIDLHVRCALAHALREIGGRDFALLDRPPAGCPRHCDACGGAARGLVYHCASLDHDVHPCCAGPPEVFDLAGLSFELRMGMGRRAPRRCALCADKGRHRRGSWFYRSVGSASVSEAVFLHVACAGDLACETFTDMSSLGSQSGSVVVDGYGFVNASHVYSSDEMVPVKASALRALLLKGQGLGNKTRGGAAARCLRVLGFIVRVVIGVIFGDPTAMIVTIGQAVFSGE